MPDSIELEERSVRRTRLALRLGVLTVWLVGVILAIKSGWIPGFRPMTEPWPYPLGQVFVVILQISVISLCLYDALRPQPDRSLRARTARATLVSLVILVWSILNTWTDQPGYAYVAATYVFIVTALLLVTLAALTAIRAFRRGGDAA